MGRSGVVPLSTDDGLALFDTALTGDEPLLLAARLGTAALRADPVALPSLLHGLVRRPRRTAADPASDPAAPGERLAELPEAELRDAVATLVQVQIARILGHSPGEAIPAGRGLRALGFDSLTAVALRNSLGVATGLRLPATLVFDVPTPADLARDLCDRIIDTRAGGGPTAPERAGSPSSPSSPSSASLTANPTDQPSASLRPDGTGRR
jgi:hypothetical protein